MRVPHLLVRLRKTKPDTYNMQERSSKRTKDINVIAANIVEQATDEVHIVKNPAAVALGRLGGLKGGKARAANLTSARRSEIARKAALARWSKYP